MTTRLFPHYFPQNSKEGHNNPASHLQSDSRPLSQRPVTNGNTSTTSKHPISMTTVISSPVSSRPDPKIWTYSPDFTDKVNELNSLKDLNRPLPSLPPAGSVIQISQGFQRPTQPPPLPERSFDNNHNTTSNQVHNINSRLDPRVYDAYSSIEEWARPESFISKELDTRTNHILNTVENNDSMNITASSVDPRTTQSYPLLTENTQNLLDSLQRPPVQGRPHQRNSFQIQRVSQGDPIKETSSRRNTVSPIRDSSHRDSRPVGQIHGISRFDQNGYKINLSHGDLLYGDVGLEPISEIRSSAKERSTHDPRNTIGGAKTPERSRDNAESDTSSSLSPLGVDKFNKLNQKSPFKVSGKDSPRGNLRYSVPQSTSISIPPKPIEKIKEPLTSDRLSDDIREAAALSTVRYEIPSQFSPQRQKEDSHSESYRQHKGKIITYSPGKTESRLPTYEDNHKTTNATLHTQEDTRILKPVTVRQAPSTEIIPTYERMSPKSQLIRPTLKVFVFNAGSFFPSRQTTSHRTPLVLTEEEIITKFRELEEDIRPHFEIMASSSDPSPVLYLDRSRTSIMKPVKSKVNPFDSINSYTKSDNYSSPFTSVSDEFRHQFRAVVEKQLSHRFKFVHVLPFTDAFGSKGEYYLVTSKEDQSILILKALLPGEMTSQNQDLITALFFKVADSTLSQLIEAQRLSCSDFKTSELRSLFHDCVAALFILQKEDQNIGPLHPDFILFDQDNQVFYILPVSFAPDYNPRNPNTPLTSLRRQGDEKQTGVTPILGYRDYMSPLLRESFENGDRECEHNPYKSCLFSLGLILLQALTLNSIEGLNQSKDLLYQQVVQYPLYITSSTIGQDYLVRCPNMLHVLLNFEEEERLDPILLYFRVFTDLPVFEDPLHPKLSPPIFDSQVTQQLQLAKKIGTVKISLSFTKGQKYIGQVKEYNGQVIRHGSGAFYNKQGELIFQGTWDQDFPKEGVFIYNNDYRYEGTWSGFYHDGYGILYYRNTPLYEGNWRGFKYHGHGKLYFTNGPVKYEGEFKLSMKHGVGKSYYPNGSVYYSGVYKNDRPHGQGTMYWPSGEIKFDGEVLCTQMDETFLKGTYYEEAGRKNAANIYVGELCNDRFHGEGILYDSYGNVLAERHWIDGDLVPEAEFATEGKTTLPYYSSLKKDDELVGELKLDCVLNTVNVNQELQEMEVFLDLHSEKNSLHVDCTRLDGQHVKTAFSIIAKNPHFTLVRTLVLSKMHDQKTCTDFKQLIESRNLVSLRDLTITRTNQLSNNMLKMLAEAPFLYSLENLSIVEAGNFSEEGLRTLLPQRSLSNLQSLRVKSPQGSNKKSVLGAVLSCDDQFTQLRKLSLVQCFLNADNIQALFTSDQLLSSIEELNLSRNQICSKGCQYMMEAGTRMENLQKLNLKACGIEAPGISFLMNSPFISNVRSLNLSQNPISNAGCDYICGSRYLENLERLALKDCGISLQGIKKMKEKFSARNLLVLELDNNRGVNNECMEYLSVNENFVSLEELSVVGCSVTAKGMIRLCESAVLRRLRLIKVFGGEMGKIAGRDVKKQLQIKMRMEIM